MKKKTVRRPYYSRPIRRYAYPNAAEPGYFVGKLLDLLTAGASVMGTIVLLMYVLTF